MYVFACTVKEEWLAYKEDTISIKVSNENLQYVYPDAIVKYAHMYVLYVPLFSITICRSSVVCLIGCCVW